MMLASPGDGVVVITQSAVVPVVIPLDERLIEKEPLPGSASDVTTKVTVTPSLTKGPTSPS